MNLINNTSEDSRHYSYLEMNNFVPPDRRIDAYPTVYYNTPLTYLADMITLKCPAECDVTVFVGRHPVFLEKDDLLFIAPFTLFSAHPVKTRARIDNVAIRPTKVHSVFPRLFESNNPVRFFLESCQNKSGSVYLHLRRPKASTEPDFFQNFTDYCIRGNDPDLLEILQWEARLEVLLLGILYNDPYYELYSGQPHIQTDILSQVLTYIQQNLQVANLADAASHLGCSPSYLSRYIRQQTGNTFTGIVQILKLDEAASLLRFTDSTIDEIMYQAGYSGKANFYSIFQNRFGMTPFQYRKAIRHRG